MSALAPASASPAPAPPGSPPDTLAPGGRVDALTGLRFLAALAVFAHHFTGLGGPGSGVARVPAFFPYTTMGVHGVGFFFVLSGFLLAWGYRPGTSVRLFYWRRAGRIWPAHLAASLLALVLLFWWGGRATDAFSVLASVLLVQTWFPGVTPTLPGNSVAWTLSVELFFYALFPLLVRGALALRTRTLLAVSAGSLAVMAAVNLWLLTHLSGAAAEWVMRHPLARLPEFGLGLAVALALRRGCVRRCGRGRWWWRWPRTRWRTPGARSGRGRGPWCWRRRCGRWWRCSRWGWWSPAWCGPPAAGRGARGGWPHR